MQKLKLISLFLVFCINGFAQDSSMFRKHPEGPRFWDKVFVGGNMGLQFGTVTFLEVSPLIGYHITDKISAGFGVTYQYYQYQDKITNFQTNVYGARVFGRYMITDNFFAYGEYEYLNLEAFDFYPIRMRVDVESLLGGGGYMQRIGSNSAMVAMLLYNFTETIYTPYQNPIIRIGFNIGL